MTAEKLLETIRLLDLLDRNLNLQGLLESIRDNLNNLSNAPTQPQYQTGLADALKGFTQASAKLQDSLSPGLRRLIAEMNGERFFDPEMASQIQASVSANGMTPSVSRDFVTGFASERSEYLANTRATLQGLRRLGYEQRSTTSAAADISFLIPRELFWNNLEAFAKELKFINRLITDFGEAITGEAQPVILEGLSTSMPTIGLAASLAVIYLIAQTIDKFIEAWGRIESIRKVRAELVRLKMSDMALEQVDNTIAATIEEVVEESTEIVVAHYSKSAERKNELKTAVSGDLHRLFAQIERGLTVEFRADPAKAEQDEDRVRAISLAELNGRMRFPEVQKDALLLSDGAIFDGEVEVTRKTTKATKTTTTRRGKPSKTESKE